jgi:uncharacterized damage-inducible protein DinB
MERQISPDVRIVPADEFLAYSRFKLFGQYWPRLQQCVAKLTLEQLWWRPNQSSNSIGNILLHLSGNVRQWMVASFNGDHDNRDRPAEFSRTEAADGTDPLAVLAKTMQEAEQALARLSEADLTNTYSIQGYTVSGLGAVYQVVEHFGLHYGQIIYITKMLTDADMGFYTELTRTGRAN